MAENSRQFVARYHHARTRWKHRSDAPLAADVEVESDGGGRAGALVSVVRDDQLDEHAHRLWNHSTERQEAESEPKAEPRTNMLWHCVHGNGGFLRGSLRNALARNGRD